jgi:YidC/Oxa1 family membrane protein insertase
MERRALIAMVLMLVVLLFYWMYAPRRSRPPEPPPTETPEVSEVSPERADSVARAITPAPPGEEAVPGTLELSLSGGPGTEVTVTTPLVDVTFNTVGAVITSFRLRDYLGVDNRPVELVPEAERRPLDLELLTATGETLDLSRAVFDASQTSIELSAGQESTLTFVMRTGQGLEVVKAFDFSADTYVIGSRLRVTGTGAETIRALQTGWQSGLNTTERNVKEDLRGFASLTYMGDNLIKYGAGKVRKQEVVKTGGDIEWTGLKTKYFLAAFVPLDAARTISKSYGSGENGIGLSLEFEKPESGTQDFLLYVGPLDYNDLKDLGLGLEKAVDFGWRWISPLTRLVFSFMIIVHRAIPNYGVVIIVLSILIKILFWPLTQKSFKSMREMQKVQPALSELKEKYKDDPKKLNEEMWKLYKERGINPAGGCLPMLMQTPVFIALFNLLSKTIELRRAPFVLWMRDLSAPDVMTHLPFSLPFIGTNVSVLPILMGIAMFVQQKMSSTDPKNAAMTYMLPIIFTVIFYRFPSGLVLYWLVNNLLTIMHQYLLARADEP